MPRGHKSRLRAQEKRRQKRAEKRGDESAQATAGEEGEAARSSSSALGDVPSTSTGAGTLQAPQGAPTTTSATAAASGENSDVKVKGQVQKCKKASRATTSTEGSGQDILTQKAKLLVHFLLCQHRKNLPLKKGDMLKVIHKWFRKDFPEILRRATERMDRFFGLELKEVKPNGNYYTLVDNQDASVSSGFRFPTKGILMPVLGFILLNDNCVPEEKIWHFLNMMSVYAGKTHFIFGEPRKLLTQDLVQQNYLVYQPVPNNELGTPRYEFLWGPRAHAETTKKNILEFFSLLNNSIRTALASQFERALNEEEEQAQARAPAAPRATSPPKASGHSMATSSP